jgi:hypothetical protein
MDDHTERFAGAKPAAAYLTELGHPISAQHLNNLRASGGGPVFHKNRLGRIVYTAAALHAWLAARDELGPAMASTRKLAEHQEAVA